MSKAIKTEASIVCLGGDGIGPEVIPRRRRSSTQQYPTRFIVAVSIYVYFR